MNIGKLLRPESVLCDVAARSRKHTLDIVSELLARASGGRLNQAEVFDTLVSRERLGCTALGHSVAIPHGQVAGIGESLGAFVRLAAPVDFDTPDEESVDLVFGLLLPKDAGARRSEELVELAQLFSHAGLREKLHAASDAQTLYEALTGYSVPRKTASA